MGAGYGGSYETGGALGEMVDLTTEVLGTLPVANGGTGATTFTNNRVLTGNSTSAIVDEANLLFTGTLLTLLDTTQAVIGHTAAVTTGASNTFQVLGTGAADSRGLVARFSADAVGPDFDFLKSRHATIASNTIVVDDDVLGRLAYYPADGTNFATLAGVFQCEVDDATPAVGDVGVAFVWRGMRGAASAIADVMRLSAGGALSPGVTDATALGTTALMWADLFLASGSVVNFDNGNVTITHTPARLTIDGQLVISDTAATAQLIASGYTLVGGSASAGNGAMRVGSDNSFFGALDFNAGTGVFYIDNGYDNAASAIHLRVRTVGTPIALIMAPTVLTFPDAYNMAFNATTGTRIGTATTQKIGFYNATPIVQGASVADASGGATVDAEARTAINALISRIEATGLIATV